MKKIESKDKGSPPLSTQLKILLITALVIGGTGFAFGALSLGFLMGNQPVTNNNDNSTYNNYTTYNTNYNTTYIYNNATGKRSIYNSCLFELIDLQQSVVYYFFNLSLKYKTVLDVVMLKNNGGADIGPVAFRYNLSINGTSSPTDDYIFQRNAMAWESWYHGPEFVGTNVIELPHTLPNGTGFAAQFRMEHTDATPPPSADFQIIIGYTVYL